MSRRLKLALIPLVLLVLTGCVEELPTVVSETPTAGYTPTPTPSVPIPVASATADTTSSPFSTACEDLISPDEMYAYNPNFGPVDGWVPSPGTLAGDGVSAQGTACRWQNQSSGATIDISVANLLEPRLSESRAQAAAAYAPAGWALDGFFTADGGPGVGQAFTDKYWITLQSTTFFAAEDAAPIVEYLASHLN